MSWKEDRALIIIWSALNYNTDPNRLYFYDRSDKTVFSLYLTERGLTFKPIQKIVISQNNEPKLQEKIQKINEGSTDIFEFVPFTERIERPNPKLPFDEGNKIYQAIADKAFTYLKANNIEIQGLDAIEY